MAKLTYTTLTPPTGRRHGITYFATANANIARANAIPVYPANFLQATANVNFSNAVWQWQQLTPSEQAGWAAYQTAGSTAYATALGWYQLWITWALPFTNLYPNSYSGILLPTTVGCWTDTAGNAIFETYFSGTLPTDRELWIRLYIDPAYLTPSWEPGYADGTAVNVPTSLGLIYAGSIGPCNPNGVTEANIQSAIIALFGQEPTTLFEGPTTGMETSSYGIFSLWFTTQYGEPYGPVGGEYGAPYAMGNSWQVRMVGLSASRRQAQFYPKGSRMPQVKPLAPKTPLHTIR